jgi:uridine phosphorylase
MSYVIPASELPLCADGSVYHLTLLPHEVAQTIILVGDPERVSLVSAHFDAVEVRKSNREFVTHTGTFQGQRLTVISTGIGTANIEIVLNELDALFNIDLSTRMPKAEFTQLRFLRIGTAGAVQADTAPGQCVLSRYAIGFDGQMHFYPRDLSVNEQALSERVGAVLSDYLKAASYVTSASTWFEQFSPLGELGITFTCPGFYAAQNRKLRLPILDDSIITGVRDIQWDTERALNFEMETAMIYGLGGVLGHECGSISLIVYNRHTQASCTDTGVMQATIKKVLDHLVTTI